MKEYGKVVLLSHSVIWVGSLAATWAALNSMDLSSAIALLPESIASHVDPSAGAFAIAFVLVKLTGPVRLMFDIAITPTLAGYLRGTWLAGPLGLRKKDTLASGAAAESRDSYRMLMGLGVAAAPGANGHRERMEAWSGQTVRFVKAKYALLRARHRFPASKDPHAPGPAVPKTLKWTLKEHNYLLRARKAGTPKRDASAPVRASSSSSSSVSAPVRPSALVPHH